MALIKKEILYNGIEVNYHRLAEFDIDTATKSGTVTMHSWPSRQHREYNLLPDMTRKYGFRWTSDNLIADAYSAIKSLPEWRNAIDI